MNNISKIHTNGGDFACGDIKKEYHQTYSMPVSKMMDLFEKFEKEKKEKPEFCEIIGRLSRYMTPLENEVVVGLENKLRHANKSDEEIKYALEMKEDYAKKLEKEQFYESAQHIHVCFLGTTRMNFMNHVYPLIQAKRDANEVANVLQNKVINPLLDIINGVDKYNNFTNEDAMGIIYYLTGNCYIKWV